MTPSRRRFLATAAAATLSSPLVANRAAARTASVPRPPPRRDDVLLALVGDVFLLEPFPGAHTAGTRAVIDALAACDATFANLEHGLSTVGSSDAGGQRYGGSLRGPPALVAELSAYDVDAVSLANNHTGNYGPDALLETIRVVEGAGIRHAGAGRNIDEAFAGARVPAGDIEVGLLAVYSMYHKIAADDRAGPARPGIAWCRAYDVVVGSDVGLELDLMSPDNDPAYVIPLAWEEPRIVLAPYREDLDRLSAAIRRLRSEVDFLVLSVHFHWGRHARADIPLHQGVFARTAIRAGADVVVGHGPHALRAIEIYQGKPILYSVGNFTLTPAGDDDGAGLEPDAPPDGLDPGRRSVVARLGLTGDAVRVELLPIWIGADGRPRLAAEGLAADILAELRGLSLARGTRVRILDDVVGEVEVAG